MTLWVIHICIAAHSTFAAHSANQFAQRSTLSSSTFSKSNWFYRETTIFLADTHFCSISNAGWILSSPFPTTSGFRSTDIGACRKSLGQEVDIDRPADLIVLDVTGKDELCFHSVGQNQILRRVIRERDELDAFGHSAHDGHAGRSRRWTDSQRTGTRLTLERADQLIDGRLTVIVEVLARTESGDLVEVLRRSSCDDFISSRNSQLNRITPHTGRSSPDQ